jgi:two-component system KDP operon response regulator KdpE
MQSDGHVVLVVEDDEGIRSLVVDFLRDEQIRAEEARDGAEALGLVEAYRPLSRRVCLILMDLMLPHVTGVEVIRHVRSLGEPVPTVALSASRTHLAEAMLAGASMAIAKPFDIEQILSVVTSHCPHGHG